MNPEIIIYMEPSSDDDDVENLKDFIVENNLPSIQARLEKREYDPGTLGGAEYLPLIKMLLGSTAVATTVKSLFDIIKKYFELQEVKTKAKADIKKAKINAGKVRLKLKDKEGKDVDLTFTVFDEEERDNFFKKVDAILK